MCVHSVIFFTRTTVVRMADKKLSDDEKIKLIQFYRDNAELWDSANPYYKNKEKRDELKQKMYEEFDGKFNAEHLEKCYHSLRSCMLREIKKVNSNGDTGKKWKFYDDMDFISNDGGKEKKKIQFSTDEMEQIIDYYRENPPLWNHHLAEYRNRDTREILMINLCKEFENKFTVADIKACS